MRRTIIFSSILLMLGVAVSSHAQHVGVFDGSTGVWMLRNSAPPEVAVFAGKTIRLRIAATNNSSKDVNDMYIFQSPVRLSHMEVPCGARSRPVNTSSAGLTGGKVAWSYNRKANEYRYDLRTDSTWKGTCRVVTLQLADGTEHRARLRFR